ncbi:unnamed protein product [Paramecium primaurelia]|uniref:Transmembrane protein n=1 Tax=Paramecium primaurelia TaxID=5886 RepID=A0A8S1PP39_PARPR|nr:unnamed protein product [Paramecium primaurelia]
MIEKIAIALCITIVTSITLNLNEICQCSQLIQEYDCINSSMECSWNFQSKECQDIPCSEILFSSFCIQQSQRCYWANGQCQNFTNCQSLLGSTQSICINQNIYCPASNGTNCQSVDYLQTCTSITTSNNCNYYFSAAGVCMWNGQSCVQATSCSQFQGNSTTSCNFSGCQLNYQTKQCQPKLCSQLNGEIQCSQGILTFGPYLNNVIGCYWNYESYTCEEFYPSQMNYMNCYGSSAGTYHWNSKKEKKGDCVSCYQQFLILSIIITMLF